MRIRVADVVFVRLAQDPKKEYLGAVTALSRWNRNGYVWELDSEDKGVVGMRLEHHADPERQVTIPRDKIVRVMSPEEWKEDPRVVDFVFPQHWALNQLVASHYKDATPPWQLAEPLPALTPALQRLIVASHRGAQIVVFHPAPDERSRGRRSRWFVGDEVARRDKVEALEGLGVLEVKEWLFDGLKGVYALTPLGVECAKESARWIR